MSTAERFSPADNKSYAHDKLSKNVDLLASFYFDFYKKYLPDSNEKEYSTLLSLGEVGETVIIACHDDSRGYHDPSSYLVKQFDLSIEPRSALRHWDVVRSDQFSGRGDNLTQILILEDQADSSLTASLTLCSGNGSEWKSSSEEGLIGSAYMLPYRAAHDLQPEDKDLFDKMLYEDQQRRRMLGKSALTSE